MIFSFANARIVLSIIFSCIFFESLSSIIGVGEYAPIPPVFGPLSLSNTLLWSWLVAIGIAIFPSARAIYDASTPSILSSINILSPALPNFLSTNIISIAFSASSLLLQTITPLPAASPSAFTTTLWSIPLTYSLASAGSSNTSKVAVGILFLFINSFAQILLDSNCAASFVGPNIFKPFCLNISTIPIASGASGPTTVKQSFSEANFAKPSKSSTFIDRLFFVPPFPGAWKILSILLFWPSFQPMACSRPPEPITKTLTNIYISFILYIFEVKKFNSTNSRQFTY